MKYSETFFMYHSRKYTADSDFLAWLKKVAMLTMAEYDEEWYVIAEANTWYNHYDLGYLPRKAIYRLVPKALNL